MLHTLKVGIVLADGFVAENPQIMDRLLRLDLLSPVTKDEVFALLDYHCNPSRDLPRPFQSQVVTGLKLPADIRASGRDVPLVLQQPLFRLMDQIQSSARLSPEAKGKFVDMGKTFASLSSLAEVGMAVSEVLRTKLSKVMGIPSEEILFHHRMDSYGVDSLVAMELRNWFAKEMAADLAVFEISDSSTISDIGLTVARKSSFRQSTWTEG